MKHLLIIILLALTSIACSDNQPVTNPEDLPIMYPEIAAMQVNTYRDALAVARVQVGVYTETGEPIPDVQVEAQFSIFLPDARILLGFHNTILTTNENGLANFRHRYSGDLVNAYYYFRIINVTDPLQEYMYLDTAGEQHLIPVVDDLRSSQ